LFHHQHQSLDDDLCNCRPLGGGTTPLPIVYYVTLREGYIQMTLFLETPKIGTFVVQKLWMFIFFSNQACLEHVRALSFSPQKVLSKSVLHAPIKDHLTPTLRGFVKLRIWLPLFHLIIIHAIRSKWTIWRHFKHLHIKNFLMVSWGPNLVLVCFSNQGFKHSGLPHESNSQSESAFGSHRVLSFALFSCFTPKHIFLSS